MKPFLTHSIVLGAALLLLVLPGQAQDISVQATVSTTTVGLEEALNYTLEIQGASFADVELPGPPETEGLALQQATPSTQRNITFVNGELTQSVAYQWSFRPVRVGTATLEPVTVTVKGRQHHTERIRVTVVPQSQRPSRQRASNPFGAPPADNRAEGAAIPAQDMFIRVVPSAREAYLNEQITIEYQLFFRDYIRPRHSRLADSWDAEGFWREEMEVDARPMPRMTVENGLRYYAIVLKRVAVFPTRPGTLTIDPLRIETEVFAPRSDDPFSQFFSLSGPYESVERASPAVSIETRPLPDGAPASFQGAVGRFEMQAQFNRRDVEVGEPIQLTVRLSGTGNISVLEAPEIEAPGIFETYDPEVQTTIDREGQQVRGAKTFTYLLVPRSNGTFTLPPVEFSYFDPQAERYRTLHSEPATIHVTGTATTPVTASTVATGLPVGDIAPLLLEARWQPVTRRPLHLRVWPYLALALPLVLLGVLYGYRRYTYRLATDTAYARNRQAHPVARKHLKQAEALLQRDEPRAFYEELDRAILGFIGNRLNVSELGLTRPQLDARLAETGIAATVRGDLQRLLDACDLGRFSPTRPTRAQMEASLDQARGLIIALDATFNQQPASAAAP